MFDIGWSEIFVIAVLAIIVIGPKDLPRVMRATGRFVRKARMMANEFRENLEQMAHEVELDEVKKSIHHVSNFNPKTAIQNSVDPPGTFLDPPILPAEDEAPVSAAKPRARAKSAASVKPTRAKAAATAKPRAPRKKAPAAKAADKSEPEA